VPKNKPLNFAKASPGGTTVSVNGTQNLREDHWLVDFGVGRDFGLGNGNAMWTLGVGVADLRSKLTSNANFTAKTFTAISHGLAGAAVLFGERSLQVTATTTAAGVTLPIAGTDSGSAAIFNADAEAGLSYWINPNLKITASYRFDDYFKALKTIQSAQLVGSTLVITSSNVDRSYSGPMLRLTSKF
jgi:hypothetical protein